MAEDHISSIRKPPAAVIHIPHSSLLIPDDVLDQYVIGKEELARELLRMTDRYTDELFELPEDMAMTVRFPVSRLVVDPERFVDDAKEEMAKVGMGSVYERTSRKTPLRRKLSDAERENLRQVYYWPHHRRLEQAVCSALAEHGRCLIIDGHSFPSVPVPYEPDQDKNRPSVCLGTDGCHTPEWLLNIALKIFRESFDSVAVNRPYSGSIVPLRYFGQDHRVKSIMIELNRALYMDEATGAKLPCFDEISKKVRKAVTRLIEFVAINPI